MSGFISKYNGEEIESILDKANSIEVGTSEENSAEPFNTITVNDSVYKIPKGQQLGLYKHTISFSVNVTSGGDGANNVSLDGGSNIVTYDVFNMDKTPITFSYAFDNARTLTFSSITYDKRTQPKTIKYAIMIGWNSITNKIAFLYQTENTARLDSIIEFYVRDFSDTVVEVVVGE